MPRKSPLAARKKTTTIDSSKLGLQGLNCGNEISVERHIPAGHARRVEGYAGIAVTVEKNQASRPMRPLGEEVNGFPRGYMCRGNVARNVRGRIHANRRFTQQLNCSLCHHDFHNRFPITSAGDPARVRVGVTTAADQRGISDAAGKFAAGAARGGGGKKVTIPIDGHGPNCALLMSTMMFGSVFVCLTFAPSFALGFANQIFWIAQDDSVFRGKTFRAFRGQHHVRAIFEDSSRNTDRILHPLKSRSRAGPKRCPVHDDGVALHASVEVEMRTITRIEDRIIFQNGDGRFNGVKGGTAARKNRPARSKRAMAPRFARIYGFVGNVPRAAVNDQSRFHRNENGKAIMICPPREETCIEKEKRKKTPKKQKSDIEIKQKQEQANQNQHGTAVHMVPWKP
jgi:hypothetical protein